MRVRTAFAIAHCTIRDPKLASELRTRWTSAGIAVLDGGSTADGVVVRAVALSGEGTSTTRPSIGTVIITGLVMGALLSKAGSSPVSRSASTPTSGLQPVWTVPPLALEPTGIQVAVVNDDDAFDQLDIVAVGLGVDRDNITIKPRVGWRGYGDPRLDSRRRPRPG